MKYLLYQIVTNLKWFCKNLIRCFLGALFFGLPYLTIPIPVNYKIMFIGTFSFVIFLLLLVVRWGLRNYAPPIKWKESFNPILNKGINVILAIPLFLLVILPFIESLAFNQKFGILAFPTIAVPLIVLLNRKGMENAELKRKAISNSR